MPSKGHFAMDERGLGGTYLIQQQFLDMYRKIHHAKKTVDNDPPNKTMFRRPYYSRFGDFYKRIPPPTVVAEAKVDTSAPASYPLIANLYINRPNRPKHPKKKSRASSARGANLPSPTSPASTTLPSPASARPGSARSQKRTGAIRSDSAAAPTEEELPQTLAAQEVTSSLDKYIEYCDDRRVAILKEIQALRRRRLIRLQGVTTVDSETALTSAAKAAVAMMDGESTGKAAELEGDAFAQGGAVGGEMTPRPPSSTRKSPSKEGGRRAQVEFGPPVSQLIIPKKDIYSHQHLSSSSAPTPPPRTQRVFVPTEGYTAVPKSTTPPLSYGPGSRYRPHGCAVIAPYEDEEDVRADNDEFEEEEEEEE